MIKFNRRIKWGVNMRELAVVVQNSNENVTAQETIKAIKNVGFNNVFLQWYDEKWESSQEEQFEICKKLGLNIIFAHLGYQNINSLWEDTLEGEKIVERYKKNIKECKQRGIFLVIMHLSTKKNPPIYNELGLNRIRNILEYAKELGVKIALENTRTRGYLEYVLDNIKDESLGVCFDVGHFHTYYNDEFDFNLIKNRIFAVHLHDNDKTADLHLIPFDGTLEWKYVIEKLKQNGYRGPVTLEFCYRYDYLNMSLEEFYKKGFEIGKKISEMFEE